MMHKVKLDWTRRQYQNAAFDARGPSVFTAMETQRGLKPEARKGHLEILALDSAAKVPTEN